MSRGKRKAHGARRTGVELGTHSRVPCGFSPKATCGRKLLADRALSQLGEPPFHTRWGQACGQARGNCCPARTDAGCRRPATSLSSDVPASEVVQHRGAGQTLRPAAMATPRPGWRLLMAGRKRTIMRMNRAAASLSRPAAPGAATDSSNGFPAVSRPDARILVLGTLPSQRSLACGEYYAHPRNQFWRIASELLGVSIDLPYEARLQHLLDRHIALWDVCAAASRPGSLDARIEAVSVVPNDFAAFFATHPEIVRVCLNGQHASKLYQRLILRTLPDHLRFAGITLPSTSPANASIPFEDKLRAWAKALL